jgi:hypothetical protein
MREEGVLENTLTESEGVDAAKRHICGWCNPRDK